MLATLRRRSLVPRPLVPSEGGPLRRRFPPKEVPSFRKKQKKTKKKKCSVRREEPNSLENNSPSFGGHSFGDWCSPKGAYLPQILFLRFTIYDLRFIKKKVPFGPKFFGEEFGTLQRIWEDKSKRNNWAKVRQRIWQKKLKKNFYVFLFVMKKQKKPTNDLGGFAWVKQIN